MAQYFDALIAGWPLWTLLSGLAISIVILVKAADLLVENATKLSLRWGVPSLVVGATLVSLGTTMPEAFVSVMAASDGRSELAMGNAVGSIICNTSLVLGVACLISPIHFDQESIHSQVWIKFICGVLLVLSCVSWVSFGVQEVFVLGGRVTQIAGWGFLVLLVLYMRWSINVAKGQIMLSGSVAPIVSKSMSSVMAGLAGAVVGVLFSAAFLISSATAISSHWDISSGIVAATLLAFGTSLPELVVVITATLKDRSEIAIGNVIGADILNVLFVVGAAAAVTTDGLKVEPGFFSLQFPAMLILIALFRVETLRRRRKPLGRLFGATLVMSYLIVTVLSY